MVKTKMGGEAMFSARLDFLMQLTNTSNSSLARAVSFDQSYISKLRSGKRRAPRNDAFVEQAAAFFARLLTSEYQKKAISDTVLGGAPFPEDRKQMEKLLTVWLTAENAGNDASMERLLHGMSRLTRTALESASASMQAGAPVTAPADPDAAGADALPFYGNAGKRAAVELFLSRLCVTGQAHTLLLYSDEDMSWLYEDPDFRSRWASLLVRILTLGGSIKMIHTVSRNATELLEAVRSWLPIYLVGRIEPYYCPRLRDGIYHRSLFVACGHSALVSTSVSSHTEGMVNLLFDDRGVTESFEREFWNYYALCRPLMQVCRSPRDADAAYAAVRRFEAGAGSLYLAQSLPSFYTMPKAVLTAMADDESLPLFESRRAAAAAAFRARLAAGGQVIELLHLPDPAVFESGGVPLPLCALLGQPELSYDAALLARHLRAVQRLMKNYEQYTVLLTDAIPAGLTIAAGEDAGAMMACPLPALFSMEEQNISAAFIEYLARTAARCSKRKSAAALTGYIKALPKPAQDWDLGGEREES